MINQNIKNKSVLTVCMLVLCIVVSLAGCSVIGQRDDSGEVLDRELAASVVYLQGNKSPEQLNRLIQPGTVVVWLNKCEEDIRIVFPERKVTIACLNPVSFNVNAEGIFDSKILSPGAVASLCFIQPGLYVYVVEWQADGKGARLEGTIVVK